MAEVYKVTSDKGFYIGDLSYALSEEIYDEVWGGQNQYRDGQIEVGDTSFAVSGTAYGDGVYYSKEIDFSFPVDAGVIGLVPMELMKEDYTKLGYLIQIPGEMTMEVDNKGDFKFTMNGRSFTIKTSELGDY